LKILFITGYAGQAVLDASQMEPGMQVVTKPFALDAIAARIRGIFMADRKPEG
jgi:hypothetical protein